MQPLRKRVKTICDQFILPDLQYLCNHCSMCWKHHILGKFQLFSPLWSLVFFSVTSVSKQLQMIWALLVLFWGHCRHRVKERERGQRRGQREGMWSAQVCMYGGNWGCWRLSFRGRVQIFLCRRLGFFNVQCSQNYWSWTSKTGKCCLLTVWIDLYFSILELTCNHL